MTEEIDPAKIPPLRIVEYSPEQFAKSIVEFYKALKKEYPEIEEQFAQHLTIEFCRRP